VGIGGDPGTDPVFDGRIERREVAGLRRVEVDQPHLEVRHGHAGEVGQDDAQPGRYQGRRHTVIVASLSRALKACEPARARRRHHYRS
jgi:hypothetical protein